MSKYGEAEAIKELSSTLRKRIKEKNFHLLQRYQLIDIFDDIAIAWSKEDGCFFTQTLSSAASNSQPIVQTISLSKPPIWDILRISINVSGTGVLIWGPHGLAVVELPKRWGNRCLFEGGAKSMTCRVVYVGESFFSSTSKLCILSASWHPGSLTHNHVAILSNDNCFRVYSLVNPNKAEISIAVGNTPSLSEERSTLNCDAVTGKLAVDFDFGAAIFPDTDASFHSKDDPEEMRKKYLEMQWPVFVLYSNGDVYYIIGSISGNRTQYRNLYGPMVMVPAAYDNYGLDYCCIIAILCSPQVLVIANTSANIHHCIVLENTHLHQNGQDSVDTITEGICDLKLRPPTYVLHVYESIKLNLSFIAGAPKLSSDILLIADPHMPSRYWISHTEGVHGVSFPLVDRLINFEESNFGLEFTNDVASCVEHFLCTKPISTVKSLPVIGLALNHSSQSVFVLLASGLIYTFPIPNSFIPYVSETYSGTRDDRNLAKYSGDSFTQHIRSLLHRSTSQPLLISGSVPDIESEEYLCMVACVVKTLKQNYMQPQVKVREELHRRVNILMEQKNNLLSDVDLMITERMPVIQRAHVIAERYKTANERQSKLLRRLEKVMSRIVSDLPTLSSSERAMMNEILAMKERSVSFEQEISKLTAKHKWQANEIKKQKNEEANMSAKLSEGEINSLQSTLNAESKRIKIMSKKVTQLKLEADV